MQTPNELAELKRVQREQWSVSAHGWNRWWSVFESGAQVVNDALCDMAQLSAGQRVLDLACGLGEPSFSAARRVGEHGLVTGVAFAFTRGSIVEIEAVRGRKLRHLVRVIDEHLPHN